jgi:hypothetical protein
VAGGGDRDRRGAGSDACAITGRARRHVVRDGHDWPAHHPTSRSTAGTRVAWLQLHVGADLDGAGRTPDGRQREDPRPYAAELLGRALAGLPVSARAGGSGCAPTPATSPQSRPVRRCWPKWRHRHGARWIVPRWHILDGVAATAWTDAIDIPTRKSRHRLLPGLVAGATRLLIRRVALDLTTGHIAADPRARGVPPLTPTSPPCPSPSSPPATPTRSS